MPDVANRLSCSSQYFLEQYNSSKMPIQSLVCVWSLALTFFRTRSTGCISRLLFILLGIYPLLDMSDSVPENPHIRVLTDVRIVRVKLFGHGSK